MNENHKTYIIAEAGVNHNGSLDLALKLVEAAKFAGADAVKFQTFKTENLVSLDSEQANYQIQNTGNITSQFNMLKQLELSYEDFKIIKKHCDEVGIQFISSPFDIESVNFLDSLGLETFKIPSGEITNFPLLKCVADKKKKIILSTGMGTLEEISAALKIIYENGTKDVTLLHCTTEYPAPFEELNLLCIKTLKETFKVPVGYSDHSIGIEAPVAAVALGAEIIEKHFTLDNTLQGPDHKASANSFVFSNMVKAIRNIEKALGTGVKTPTSSELKNIKIVRQYIVAAKNIKENELFTVNNLTTKRVKNGKLLASDFEKVVGQRAKRIFIKDEPIEL